MKAGRPMELNLHQRVGAFGAKGRAQPMASQPLISPGNARHLYRYRTSALVGPWRKTEREAVRDAVNASQAHQDRRFGGVLRWLVPGEIEEMELEAA